MNDQISYRPDKSLGSLQIGGVIALGRKWRLPRQHVRVTMGPCVDPTNGEERLFFAIATKKTDGVYQEVLRELHEVILDSGGSVAVFS